MRKYILFLLMLFLMTFKYSYGMDEPKQQLALVPTQSSEWFDDLLKHESTAKCISIDMCVSGLYIMPAALKENVDDISKHLSVQKYQNGTYHSQHSRDTIFGALLAVLSQTSKLTSSEQKEKIVEETPAKSEKKEENDGSTISVSRKINAKQQVMEFHANVSIASELDSSEEIVDSIVGVNFTLPVWHSNAKRIIPAAYKNAVTQQFIVQEVTQEEPIDKFASCSFIAESSTIKIVNDNNILQAILVIPSKEANTDSPSKNHNINISNFNPQFFSFMQKVASDCADCFLICSLPGQKAKPIIVPITEISIPISLPKALPSISDDGIGNGILTQNYPYFSILYGKKTLFFKASTSSCFHYNTKTFLIAGKHENGKQLTIRVASLISVDDKQSTLSRPEKEEDLFEVTFISQDDWQRQKEKDLIEKKCKIATDSLETQLRTEKNNTSSLQGSINQWIDEFDKLNGKFQGKKEKLKLLKSSSISWYYLVGATVIISGFGSLYALLRYFSPAAT